MESMIIEEEESESLIRIFNYFYQPDEPTPCNTWSILERVNNLLNDALEHLYNASINSEWYECPFLFHYAMKLINTILDKLGHYPIDSVYIIDFQGSILIEY